MKNLDKIKTHKLATQPLKDLLRMAGQPTTPEQKRIMASLARAYEQIGDTFPTKQLGNDLDDLYSQAASVTDRVQVALAALVNLHSRLSVEAMGLSVARMTAQSQEKTVRAWSHAFHVVDQDLTPAVMRRDELPFLALAAASKQIRAAVKTAKKR